MTRLRCVSLLIGVLLSCVGCGGQSLPIEPLEAIPFPELADAESEVREQLDAAKQSLEAAEAATLPAKELAAAYGSLGELYHGYDLAEAAMACYRNAYRLAPGEPRWLHLLGVLHRLEGGLEAASTSFAQVLELTPDDLAATLHWAQVKVELDALDEAADLARRALEIEPTSAVAYATLGRVYTAREQHAEAASSYEQALELAPTASRLHYLAGQAYRRLGDLEAARGHLAKQGQGDVHFADPRVASVYASLAGSAAWMQRAARAEVAGQLEASVEIYRQAVAKSPASAEARRDLGALLSRVGRYEEAAEQYREAVQLEPERGLNHFVLALVSEAMGDRRAAIESMQTAVAAEPDYREFRLALAGRLAQAGRFQEALGHFDRVLSSSGETGLIENQRARVERAKTRLELGDATGAAEDAEAVLRSETSDRLRAEALALQGAVAARGGDRTLAVSRLEQALALDESLVGAQFELANLAGIGGDLEQAAARYGRVTELDPGRVAAWLGEATALALGGREADAASRLEAGLQANPDAGMLGFALARLQLTSQDPQIRDPGRALEIVGALFEASRSPESADLLVLAFAANGRIDDAIRLQRQLIEAMPRNAPPELRRTWTARLAELEQNR